MTHLSKTHWRSARVVTRLSRHVTIEASDEGGFTVVVPALPGCVSEGETREEALQNIREAIELYLQPVEDDLPVTPDAELLQISL